MNLTDELLRSALDETADEIEADRVPPLRLTVGRAPSSASLHMARLRCRWLTAAAAAATVVAVIAGSTVLAARGSGRPSPSREPAAVGIGPLPRFYAVILSTPPTSLLAIHNARTGATLATAKLAPGETNDLITAAADDTTFVIGQQRQAGPMAFLLARFDPARNSLTLRRLTLVQTSGDAPEFIALSPDGTQLAAAVDFGGLKPRPSEIRIYSLATGAVKMWTTPADPAPLQGLSWASDRSLGFDFVSSDGRRPGGIWLLTTSAPAGDLLADSRLVVRQGQPGRITVEGTFAMINNGAAVVTIVLLAHQRVYSRFEVLSTRTGRVIRTFLPSTLTGGEEGLYWSNSTGTVLAGFAPYTGPHPNWLGPLEWISGSRHTPVKRAGIPAFGTIAF